MLKNIGQLATLTIFKIVSRFGHRPASVNIFDQIDQARHVLLCLPDNLNGSQANVISIENFKQVFPNAKITIMYNTNMVFDKSIVKDCQIIDYNPASFTTFGQPPRSFKINVVNKKFDIAIDLSINFCFINTLTVWISRACLRVGFNHLKRDDLYNFLIRVKQGETWENSYKTLFRYLGAKLG